MIFEQNYQHEDMQQVTSPFVCMSANHYSPLDTLRILSASNQSSASRYETEEHAGVCEAMERIANLFLSDSGSIEEIPEG